MKNHSPEANLIIASEGRWQHCSPISATGTQSAGLRWSARPDPIHIHEDHFSPAPLRGRQPVWPGLLLVAATLWGSVFRSRAMPLRGRWDVISRDGYHARGRRGVLRVLWRSL